jgi:predicted CopG family antitoxin
MTTKKISVSKDNYEWLSKLKQGSMNSAVTFIRGYYEGLKHNEKIMKEMSR